MESQQDKTISYSEEKPTVFHALTQTSEKVLDVTDPNLNPSGFRPSNNDIYFYHEKTIIHLLQKESISEEDYNSLFLLVNTPISPLHCIAYECWLPISELKNFEAFQEKEKSLKTALSQRLNFIKTDAEFIYETLSGKNCYLLSSDLWKLDLELIKMLNPHKQRPVSFNYFVINDISIQLGNLVHIYHGRALEPVYDKAILEQEQDAAPGSIYRVQNEKAYRAYNTYKTILNKDFHDLIQFIIKMRFHQEFNNPLLSQKLQSELEKSLFSTAVRLNRPLKNADPEKVQGELNKLLFAAKRKHEIRQLVQYGANLDAIDSDRVTVLGDAIDNKLVDKASLLLSLGANPDLYSNRSPILILAIKKQLPDEFILALIKKTKNVDSQDKYQSTALEEALGKSLTECSRVIRALVEKGASLSLPGHNGNIPLIEAMRHGNVKAVEYILESGPELVNTVNSEGQTALMVAIQCWYKPQEACKAIDLLVKAGATIDMNAPFTEKKIKFRPHKPLLEHFEKSKEALRKAREDTSYGRDRFHPVANDDKANVTAPNTLTPT